jgi:hypothetical protein
MTAPALPAAPVRLAFQGTALQLLRWLLLSVVAALVIVPLAWVTAAAARWFCRHTRFSDATTIEFRGTGGEAVVWHAFFVLIVAGQQFLLREVAGDPTGMLLVFVSGYVLLVYILLMLIKWFVYNVKIEPGPAMSFNGSYLALAGWQLLNLALLCTLVGWAWGVAAQYRWMAKSIKGRGLRFEFHGKGHEILWRTLAVAAGSALIVTIPWLTVWLMRWLMANVTMRRVEEIEWLSEPSSQPRPMPSSPGPHSPVLPID